MRHNQNNIEFILEQILNGKPKKDFADNLNNEKLSELNEVLETAQKIKSVANFNADDDFRNRLKNEILSKVKMQKQTLFSGKKRSLTFLRFRRTFAVSVAILLLSFSTAFASTNAMPDSPLYPIKKAVETISKVVSNDQSRASKILDFNLRRIQEIKYLQKNKDYKKISQLMKEINENIKEINAILSRAKFAEKEELKNRLSSFISQELEIKSKPIKKESSEKVENKSKRWKEEKNVIKKIKQDKAKRNTAPENPQTNRSDAQEKKTSPKNKQIPKNNNPNNIPTNEPGRK